MADATARRCYARDRRLVAVKQRVQEAPVAHPERVGAKSETGEATAAWVDDHSDHGGASNDDGDAHVAAVDKRVKQLITQHHGNMAKLTACQAQAETGCGALATAKRARRRCCRPRGRKAASGGSRWTQATTVGGMGSQGGDGAGTLLCRGWLALRSRGKLNGVETAASGNRGEKGMPTMASELYSAAKRARERHAATISCQRESKGGHGRV